MSHYAIGPIAARLDQGPRIDRDRGASGTAAGAASGSEGNDGDVSPAIAAAPADRLRDQTGREIPAGSGDRGRRGGQRNIAAVATGSATASQRQSENAGTGIAAGSADGLGQDAIGKASAGLHGPAVRDRHRPAVAAIGPAAPAADRHIAGPARTAASPDRLGQDTRSIVAGGVDDGLAAERDRPALAGRAARAAATCGRITASARTAAARGALREDPVDALPRGADRDPGTHCQVDRSARSGRTAGFPTSRQVEIGIAAITAITADAGDVDPGGRTGHGRDRQRTGNGLIDGRTGSSCTARRSRNEQRTGPAVAAIAALLDVIDRVHAAGGRGKGNRVGARTAGTVAGKPLCRRNGLAGVRGEVLQGHARDDGHFADLRGGDCGDFKGIAGPAPADREPVAHRLRQEDYPASICRDRGRGNVLGNGFHRPGDRIINLVSRLKRWNRGMCRRCNKRRRHTQPHETDDRRRHRPCNVHQKAMAHQRGPTARTGMSGCSLALRHYGFETTQSHEKLPGNCHWSRLPAGAERRA